MGKRRIPEVHPYKRGFGLVVVVFAFCALGAGAPQAAPTRVATAITSAACPQTVSGAVRLDTDLLCTNSSALIVGADNTVIDFNGHKIVCTGSGYGGSCQGDTVERGLDTNDHDGVTVLSRGLPGRIEGFDQGVYVRTLSDRVTVRQLRLTGPALAATPPYRPAVFGVLVEGNHCAGGGVVVESNEADNHTTGMRLSGASCVTLKNNMVHDNSGGDPELTLNVGIRVRNSSSNVVRDNVVTNNGSGVVDPPPPDSGISLDNALTTNNSVVGNRVNGNNGEGISTAQGAAGNNIVSNEMRNNTKFDAYSDNSGANIWTANNRCQTQTAPDPPAGVCNPGE